jgi:epsin
LEYLVKHGAERVVDDARSHIATVKMLRNFHYIDEKSKDQGINVRNRAKELAELLGDIEKVKSERKKAKGNRNKYTGVSSTTSLGYSGSASRYSGFGGESDGYGGSSGGFHDEDTGNNGSKYDDFESSSVKSERRRNAEHARWTKASEEEPSKVAASDSIVSKEANLFDFGDEPASNAVSVDGGDATKATDDDWDNIESSPCAGDDYNDYQSALDPTASTPFDAALPALKPPFTTSTSLPKVPSTNLFDFLDSTSVARPVASQPALNPAMGKLPPPLISSNQPTKPTSSTAINLKPGDVWSSSLVSLDLGKPAEIKPTPGPSMASLAQTSASAAWTTFSQPAGGMATQVKRTQNFDDLLS